jgi:bile acid-coenzyme A ligase
MGHLDAEGYLYIADRRTDTVVVGGVNVYPAEIEAAIDSLPGVLGSGVLGLPDPDLGSQIHAIVEIGADRPQPDTQAMLTALRDRLTGFKVPRTLEFTRQHIRDDAGKVRRSALREQRLVSLT